MPRTPRWRHRLKRSGRAVGRDEPGGYPKGIARMDPRCYRPSRSRSCFALLSKGLFPSAPPPPAPTSEQVASAAAAATASAAVLEDALRRAHRATVARALAHADACGVPPPDGLLGGTPDERRRSPLAPQPQGGRTARGEAEPAPPVQQPRTSPAGEEAEAAAPPGVHESGDPPRRSVVGPRRRRPRSPQRTPRPEPRAEPHAPGVPGCPARVVATADSRCATGERPFFSREWCGAVDDWCRETARELRSRRAADVVRSGRRLHWLAGGAGERGARRRERGRPEGRSGDAAAFAALAAFVEVPDLLEITASLADVRLFVERVAGPTAGGGEAPRPAEETEEHGAAQRLRAREQVELPRHGGSARPGVPAARESTTTNEDVMSRSLDPRLPRGMRNDDPGGDSSGDVQLTAGPRAPRRVPRSVDAVAGYPEEHEVRADKSPTEACRDRGDGRANPGREPARSQGTVRLDPEERERATESAADTTRPRSRRGVGRGEGPASEGGCERQRPPERLDIEAATLERIFGVPPVSAIVLRAGRLAALRGPALDRRRESTRDPASSSPPPSPPSGTATTVRGTQQRSHADSRERGPRAEREHLPRRGPPPRDLAGRIGCPGGQDRAFEAERKGFADAIEALVRPLLRVSRPERGDGPAPVPSLRLASPTGARGADPRRRVSREGIQPGDDEPARSCPRVGRFLRAPVSRWARRVDGRPYLVSCPSVAPHAAWHRPVGLGADGRPVSGAQDVVPSQAGDELASSREPSRGDAAGARAGPWERSDGVPVRAGGVASGSRPGVPEQAFSPGAPGAGSEPRGEAFDGRRAAGSGSLEGPRAGTEAERFAVASDRGEVLPCDTAQSSCDDGGAAVGAHFAPVEPRTPARSDGGIGDAGCLHAAPGHLFLGPVPDAMWRHACTGFALERPSCQNCGRASLGRLGGILFAAQVPAALRDCSSASRAGAARNIARSPPHEGGVVKAARRVSSNRLSPAPSEEEKQPTVFCGGFRRGGWTIPSRGTGWWGRRADWLCSNGSVLCDSCTRLLRLSPATLMACIPRGEGAC